MDKHIGHVVQVTGPVLDIKFKPDELPALLNAIEINLNGARLVAEVAQQIGDNTVRCIAMNSTDGMVRGISGMILLKASEIDLDVITLLGSAKQDMPDPKGAAKLMEPLTRLLPELKIDTEPLYKEAEEIEKKIRSQQLHQYENQDIYG